MIATFSAKENTCYAFHISYRLIDVVEFRSQYISSTRKRLFSASTLDFSASMTFVNVVG